LQSGRILALQEVDQKSQMFFLCGLFAVRWLIRKSRRCAADFWEKTQQ
jgi:hypothetical protein